MKLKAILENIIDFPMNRRGMIQDEITGQWIPDPALSPQETEYWVVDDRYAYSFHTSFKEADIAAKKLRLKGKKTRVQQIN